MDETPNLNQNVNTLFSNLEGFTQNEGLLGKPLTHGDKTFIPIVSVTLGYGSGSTASKPQQGNAPSGIGSIAGAANMAGGALGLGARLTTDAVIVVDKDNISMMPLNATANASQLMDKIPQMLQSMGKGQQAQQSQQAQQGQQTQQGQQVQQKS